MKEGLIESERNRTIQESLCGFLLDEIINRKGEFYSDQKISVGRLDRNNRGGDNDEYYSPFWILVGKKIIIMATCKYFCTPNY